MTQLSLWGGQGQEPPTLAPPSVPEPRAEGAVMATAVDPVAEAVAQAGSDVGASAAWDALALSEALSGRLARRVRVSLTENRSTMVSSRTRAGVLEVRLHRMFEQASPEIVMALAAYFERSDRRAGRVIDAFIEVGLRTWRRPEVVCQPRGRFHDLTEIFVELNSKYFHGASRARITWGSAGGRRYRRSIQLGCYVREDQLIRMHPCLDQAFVPRFYVSWIVFHEMLHEVFGVERRGERHSVHPPEFVAIEQSHPDYGRAKQWEEQHLHRLLRFRGEGR